MPSMVVLTPAWSSSRFWTKEAPASSVLTVEPLEYRARERPEARAHRWLETPPVAQ